MNRDMDIIRTLLLKLEPMGAAQGVKAIGGDMPELAIDGVSSEQIEYHLALLREHNLIACNGRVISGRMLFQRLTWAGHDFLDAIRDDQVWSKTKKAAEGAGGWTFDLLKELAKGLIKKQIEEYTGVKV